MASIQKIMSPVTGDISYRAQVRIKGRPSEGKTFPNKREAQLWAGAVEAAIRESRYFPQAKAARTTFAEAVERYKNEVLKGTKRAGKLDKQLQW